MFGGFIGILGIPRPMVGTMLIIFGIPTPLPGPARPLGACETVESETPLPIGCDFPCPTFGISLNLFD